MAYIKNRWLIYRKSEHTYIPNDILGKLEKTEAALSQICCSTFNNF